MGNTILIVDDSHLDVEMIAAIITKDEPFRTIIIANDGEDALMQAVRHQPDLIIMDWEMPGMCGLDTLKVLKKNELTADLPVILISGNDYNDKIELAFGEGAADFIQKPVNKEELKARTKSVLQNYATFKSLKDQTNQLTLANHKNERILKSILPLPILMQIKEYGSIPPKRYKDCVAIFVDMVDFTTKTGKMSPGVLLRELHELFNGFDAVIDEHFCTRIKTVGDAYIAVCGMFYTPDQIEIEAASAAVKIREYIIERNLNNEIKWEVKIGLYNGDIIGSSVSPSNLNFDIFGETVNMASRFQTMCEPMQINVSESLSKPLSEAYKLVTRVPKKVKGKGVMPMYYIHKPLKPIKKEEAHFMPAPSMQ
ncbi:adenylate/guanylate cyclase domain-containing response regulator [Carboxylicivirga marina]|uniref:Adenylate/guanylate cyclase domain-containing response regulator n=1 Tax=Carboxylicivirga marina TaxID=2800988 RepID=A0ABS1HQM9_9BACT|nr:adenylate/guanylate cyclase domain-containing response regulator [Carboxylicivirga marina]MBK3519992.1 adenylate/guanylate cyclase domain-containing response regulator [Carboxylicivirga marina]